MKPLVINPATGKIMADDLAARKVADEAKALRTYRQRLQAAVYNRLPIAEVQKTIDAIIEIRDNPEVDPRVRLAACTEILDRVVGKPRVIQEVEVEQRRENVLEIITQRFGLTMLEGEIGEGNKEIAARDGDTDAGRRALPPPDTDAKP